MKRGCKWLLRATFFSLLLLSAPDLSAQKGVSQKQQEKMLAKKAKEDAKLKKKKEKENRRHHLSIQSKDVRKRIRKNTKRADKKGSGAHRDPFYQRWFKGRK